MIDKIIKLPSDLPLSDKDPNFPIVAISQALKAELLHKPHKVISILEKLLMNKSFHSVKLIKTPTDPKKLSIIIGRTWSNPIWNHLIKLLLGRAYYEIGNPSNAINYFREIQLDRPLGIIAKIEEIWCYIQLKRWNEATHIINQIINQITAKKVKISPVLWQEIKLLKSYIRLRNNYSKKLKHLNFPKSKLLSSINIKLNSYTLYEVNRSAYKKDHALQTIQILTQLPNQYLDIHSAKLLAICYLRLYQEEKGKSPKKKEYLSKALKILSPWIFANDNKVLKEAGAESIFIGAAILWATDQRMKALGLIKKTILLFPRNNYRSDCFLLLADHCFKLGLFRAAIYLYQQIIKEGDTEKSLYGLYWASWCFYHTGKKFKALRHIERFILHKKDYFANINNDNDKDNNKIRPNSLLSSKQPLIDMLFILAELLSPDRALKELSLFKFNSDQLITAQSWLFLFYIEREEHQGSIMVLRNIVNLKKAQLKPSQKGTEIETVTDDVEMLNQINQKLQLKLTKEEAEKKLIFALITLKEAPMAKKFLNYLIKKYGTNDTRRMQMKIIDNSIKQ